MKRLITLAFATVLFVGLQAQTTYYTCATPSGTNVSTDENGATCTESLGTWNVAGNTLIVRAGTTYSSQTPNSTFDADVVVFGTLDLGTGGGTTTISSSSTIVIEDGGIMTWGGSRTLTIVTGGKLVVNSGGLVQGASSAATLAVNGSVTGSGTIDVPGGISGGGTINGQDPSSVPNPIDLSTIGFIWDGTSWSPSAPDGAEDRAIFNGNYTFSGDAAYGSPVFPAGGITINSGFTATFDGNVDLTSITSAAISGTVELVDNTTINETIVPDPNATGQVKVTRTFPTVSNDWVRMGFPVRVDPNNALNFPTWGDVVTIGFLKSNSGNTANFYYWDASTSNWELPTASTPLPGTAFAVFPFSGANRSISVTVPIAEFNNAGFSFDLAYNDGTSSNASFIGPSDGWNQLYNPFMGDISSIALTDSMAATSDFQSNAVSIWNGTQYKVWSNSGGDGNDADAEFIRSFEAFFVQASDPNSGSFTITESLRGSGANSANSVNYFKTSSVADGLYVTLDVAGNGETVRTYVAQNDNATSGFDIGEDVSFLAPAANMPVFYSIDADGKAMRFNKVGTVSKKQIMLGFTFPTNGEEFTISAANFDLPQGVNAKLTDLHTGSATMINKKSYTFTHDANAPVNRFKLQFVGNTKSYKTYGDAESLGENLVNAWVDGEFVNIMLDEAIEDATVSIFNTAGQMVASESFTELAFAQFALNKRGLYVVHITAANGLDVSMKVLR